ncbi:hypothetical protein [Amycolatopsis sp. NPDC006125]|uniref:hypothetical protein n=1 Tax=Amycolatopsis sp. NPDC006125 TaxID=3156730 RepID=UPI0033BDC138
MLNHTMIVSFDQPIPDAELDQYLKDIENLMLGSGLVQTFAARRHIRVPADGHSPVFVASAIIQLGVADLDALNAVFTVPGTRTSSRAGSHGIPTRSSGPTTRPCRGGLRGTGRTDHRRRQRNRRTSALEFARRGAAVDWP